MVRMVRLVALTVVAAWLLLGCQDKDRLVGQPPRPVVITTLFPLYDFARSIAGDRMEVQFLLPPGVEPHHFEPKPDELARIHRAAIFVYTGPFMEPWVEKVLNGVDRSKVRVVQASAGLKLLPAAEHAAASGHGHSGTQQRELSDPHVWLDFGNDQQMVARLLEAFIAADPAGAEQYRRRAEALTEQLAALDKRYQEGLAACESRVLLHGGHAAFGYLAQRYQLEYLAAAGVSAELEATPRRLAELVKQVRKHRVKAVFTEELVSPRVARTIAGETGATLLKLHGAHNISKQEFEQGTGFIQLMDENLKNLQAGLLCKN